VSLAFLLDTNIISEPLRPSPNQQTLARLQQHTGEITTASVVWHELLFGCQRLAESAKRDAIEDYLTTVVAVEVPILPYDVDAASWHASERARLVAIGKTPPFVDGQIAAIAAVNDLTLVTANVSDYAYFEGVRVENWNED
jgi:tRNA(fMet)-specific endonuclease VapC